MSLHTYRHVTSSALYTLTSKSTHIAVATYRDSDNNSVLCVVWWYLPVVFPYMDHIMVGYTCVDSFMIKEVKQVLDSHWNCISSSGVSCSERV